MESVELVAARPSDRSASRRGSLVAYFGLTFLVAWTLWTVAGALAPASWPLTVRAQLFLPGTFAPGIVALWMTWRAEGRTGLHALLSRLFVPGVGPQWYLVAASYMAAAKLSAAALYRLFVGTWPAFGPEPWYLLLVATAFSTPFQAGEEVGWRGYALPRLTSRLGIAAANALLGVVWATWHLPLFFMAGTDSTGQPFVPYLLAVMALSIAMGWLYVRSGGSLLLTMLMHAAANNMTGIVPSRGAHATSPFSLHTPLIAWLTVAVLWAGAACFLAWMVRADLSSERTLTLLEP